MSRTSKGLITASGIIVLVLLAWVVFFHIVPPDVLVRRIGVQNSYLFAFLLALIAGFSSITGTSLYATITALAHSGMNAFILGVVSGLGLFLSDSLFYFVAAYGRDVIIRIASRWERAFNRVQRWIQEKPDWLVYSTIFFYTAFVPIPNDILLAVLAVSGYTYKQFFPYMLLGDVTGMLLIAYLAQSVG